jgi:hypothetical protein
MRHGVALAGWLQPGRAVVASSHTPSTPHPYPTRPRHAHRTPFQPASHTQEPCISRWAASRGCRFIYRSLHVARVWCRVVHRPQPASCSGAASWSRGRGRCVLLQRPPGSQLPARAQPVCACRGPSSVCALGSPSCASTCPPLPAAQAAACGLASVMCASDRCCVPPLVTCQVTWSGAARALLLSVVLSPCSPAAAVGVQGATSRHHHSTLPLQYGTRHARGS